MSLCCNSRIFNTFLTKFNWRFDPNRGLPRETKNPQKSRNISVVAKPHDDFNGTAVGARLVDGRSSRLQQKILKKTLTENDTAQADVVVNKNDKEDDAILVRRKAVKPPPAKRENKKTIPTVQPPTAQQPVWDTKMNNALIASVNKHSGKAQNGSVAWVNVVADMKISRYQVRKQWTKLQEAVNKVDSSDDESSDSSIEQASITEVVQKKKPRVTSSGDEHVVSADVMTNWKATFEAQLLALKTEMSMTLKMKDEEITRLRQESTAASQGRNNTTSTTVREASTQKRFRAPEEPPSMNRRASKQQRSGESLLPNKLLQPNASNHTVVETVVSLKSDSENENDSRKSNGSSDSEVERVVERNRKRRKHRKKSKRPSSNSAGPSKSMVKLLLQKERLECFNRELQKQVDKYSLDSSVNSIFE